MGKDKDLVELRSGKFVSQRELSVVDHKLRGFVHLYPLAFIEFVRLCRDPKRKLHASMSDILIRQELLLEGNIVPEDIIDIVADAVVGDGIDMEIVNPRKKA